MDVVVVVITAASASVGASCAAEGVDGEVFIVVVVRLSILQSVSRWLLLEACLFVMIVRPLLVRTRTLLALFLYFPIHQSLLFWCFCCLFVRPLLFLFVLEN